VVAKLYLEMVNYIEHYGLVRIPGQRVEPRHSWDSHRRVSNGVLYQLPLHSTHHRFATKPFWDLEHAPDNSAPMLPLGYMPMIFISFFPQLWWVVSDAMLSNWDRNYASPEERKVIEERGWFRG
jgi:alkane 1-monooxygenase